MFLQDKSLIPKKHKNLTLLLLSDSDTMALRRSRAKRAIRRPLRRRITKASALPNPLSPNLLSAESRKSLRQRFSISNPYNHISFDPLCQDDRMRLICEEVKRLNATYKETDLFKLFQTLDLANIKHSDEIAPTVQQLLSLRDSIYSQEFREFVSEVTGCGELTDRVDCAANAYVKGCHLLCHDDVIGNRKISYIIYLTDPDDPWLFEDGGLLELYPLDEAYLDKRNPSDSNKAVQGIPATNPTAFVVPKFNTMALFEGTQ